MIKCDLPPQEDFVSAAAHDLTQRAFGVVHTSQREQHDPQVVERSQARRFVIIKLECMPDVDDCFGNLSAKEEGRPQGVLRMRLNFTFLNSLGLRRNLA